MCDAMKPAPPVIIIFIFILAFTNSDFSVVKIIAKSRIIEPVLDCNICRTVFSLLRLLSSNLCGSLSAPSR